MPRGFKGRSESDGVLFAWPFAARAQQSRKQSRIAFVHSGIPAEQLTETAGPLWVRRFYEALRKLGDVEGDNLVVERYSAEGRTDHLSRARRHRCEPQARRHRYQSARTRNGLHAGYFGDTDRRNRGNVDLGRTRQKPCPPWRKPHRRKYQRGKRNHRKAAGNIEGDDPSLTKVAYLASARAAWEDDTGLSARQAGSRLGVAVSGIFPTEFNEI